jgi:release factor glutamine methyltransferase
MRAIGRESRVDRSEKELLLAQLLGKDRAWLIAHPDAQLAQEQICEYDALLERRERGEPIAYITGEAWFYGRPFAVDQSVLIPRPETERLIDDAIAHLRGYANPVVLDVGTGSGAIAITIAAEVPRCRVYATERSPAALESARHNAQDRLDAEVSVVHLELADLLPSDASLRFDAVVANLPYIPTADLPQPPNPVSFEPREALDGGADGLREYRRLLDVLLPRVNERAIVLLEAAPPTIASLRELATRAFPRGSVDVGYDYAGLERYVRVVL